MVDHVVRMRSQIASLERLLKNTYGVWRISRKQTWREKLAFLRKRFLIWSRADEQAAQRYAGIDATSSGYSIRRKYFLPLKRLIG